MATLHRNMMRVLIVHADYCADQPVALQRLEPVSRWHQEVVDGPRRRAASAFAAPSPQCLWNPPGCARVSVPDRSAAARRETAQSHDLPRYTHILSVRQVKASSGDGCPQRLNDTTRGGGCATVRGMQIVGRVAQQWRYPVKSMKAERHSGIRWLCGCLRRSRLCLPTRHRPKGFPFLTARQYPEMLQDGALFLNPDSMALPPNRAKRRRCRREPRPCMPIPLRRASTCTRPQARCGGVDDPGLVTHLADAASGDGEVTLLRSDRAFTDCRPVSLISAQTVQLRAGGRHRVGRATVPPERLRRPDRGPGLRRGPVGGTTLTARYDGRSDRARQDPRCKTDHTRPGHREGLAT